MGYIVRGITKSKNARFFCVDSTDVVQKAQSIHKCAATAAAAFGRMLTAGLLMGEDLKDESNVLTIQLSARGEVKNIVVTANGKGQVKGYISNPLADKPLNSIGKLDVKGIVDGGFLRVIKDLGMKKPYIGVSNIVSGEIGEDVAYYYFTSEQIPSVVGVGVLVSPGLTIKKAGGFIIQLLPDAKEEFIDKLEEKTKKIKSVTDLLDKGMTPEDIAKYLFDGVDEIEFLGKKEVDFFCDCNREKFYKGVIATGKDEINHIFSEHDNFETVCHFCGVKYTFEKNEFQEFIEE